MSSAFRDGRDIHTATAMRVFGVSESDVSIELRKKAKAINFGILYGMGIFRLLLTFIFHERMHALILTVILAPIRR